MPIHRLDTDISYHLFVPVIVYCLESAQIVNNLQFIAGTVSGNVATARFGLGTNNVRYNITVRINTTQGLTYERSVILPIRER